MEKKRVVIMVCMLMLITSVVPVTARLSMGDVAPSGVASDWITLPDPAPSTMALEPAICHRMSFHYSYPSTPVSDQDLSTVLWAAYGTTSTGARTVYSPNGTYSTTIYVIRSEATYTYVAENHSLKLWKTGNYLYLGQGTGAPIKFGLVWNESITPDEKAAMMDIGMIAQNEYFEAISLGLATITTGMGVSDLYDLGLPSNEKPEIIMHLGYPPEQYDFTYSPLPEQNLPPVINNTATLVDAVTNRTIVSKWDNVTLPILDESQTLWCSYGSSYLIDHINNQRHRTLPSAVGYYPFVVYALNQTAVYKYNPATHAVTLIVTGDKRALVQAAIAHDGIDVASAPWVIIPFYDHNNHPSYLAWWWYETGAIIHNVFLEATARNLTCNAVTVTTDPAGLRAALGLSSQTNLIPEAVVMVGHPFSGGGQDTTPPVTTCTLAGTQQGGAYISPVEVTLTATDDISGVNITRYKVDTGNWTTYVSPFAVTGDGPHTVSYYSVDKVGNTEVQKNTPFVIQFFNITTINLGFGVSAVVENLEPVDQIKVPWSISFSGGFVIPRTPKGTVDITAEGNATVSAKVFGLGKPTITITVGKESKAVKGFIFFFFILRVT
ncbi:MAG TPA: nitroreductase family protein [Candidatus Thermoplasmatota archaeon]|nr:nitroreductase family protein [Candidatus Thermoplasmatota archaeon]